MRTGPDILPSRGRARVGDGVDDGWNKDGSLLGTRHASRLPRYARAARQNTPTSLPLCHAPDTSASPTNARLPTCRLPLFQHALRAPATAPRAVDVWQAAGRFWTLTRLLYLRRLPPSSAWRACRVPCLFAGSTLYHPLPLHFIILVCGPFYYLCWVDANVNGHYL